MSADISVRLTAAVRAADSRFESVGGSSRHFVNECLLPALEAGRLAVVDALVPQHLKSAERDVNSLANKLGAADHRVAALEHERILLGACLTKAEGQRDVLLAALEKMRLALATLLENEDVQNAATAPLLAADEAIRVGDAAIAKARGQ